MPFYEHVFIARQDVPSATVETLIDGFAELIEQGGGKVTKKENWGLKSLAYRIKKNRKGHYVLMNIDGPSDAILEMERQMRLHDDILRYMTIRVDELDEEPSIQMHAKSSRDERARRRRDENDDDRGGRGTSGPPAGDRDADKKAAEKPAAADAPAPADDAPAKETEEVT